MKIAIDGPAGSGKSTIARALAERCGMTYLDTGAMYRSVTWACLRDGVDPSDAAAVADTAARSDVRFVREKDGSQRVLLDGEDVTAQIRTPEVDRNVSVVSAVPAVRALMVERQRALAGEGDVVAEGRDIGTVVFPDAEVKVFLTADPKARAHRRAVQRAGGDAAVGVAAEVDPEQEQAILEGIERRDRIDSTRETTPLRRADDAHLLDSSDLTVEQELEQIMGLVAAAREAGGPTGQAAPSGPTAPAPDATAKPASDVPAPARLAPAPKPAPKPAPAEGRMRAFAGNSFDDYYDHAMRDYPWTAKALLGFLVGVVGAATKVLWPWRFEGAERLWDASAEGGKGRVIVMNHVSMLDPVVVYVSEWVHGRRVRCVYKSEFDKVKVATWLFTRAGAVPVRRGTADIKVVRRAQRALERGEDVLIFPEGTRVKADDEEVELHGGFALMAQLAKARVLPVAIVGARDITTRTRKVPHFHRVFLKAGEPIGFDGIGAKGRKRQAAEMERVAMERVYALRDELRAEHPGKL